MAFQRIHHQPFALLPVPQDSPRTRTRLNHRPQRYAQRRLASFLSPTPLPAAPGLHNQMDALSVLAVPRPYPQVLVSNYWRRKPMTNSWTRTINMTTATSTPPQPPGPTPSRRYREANASRCSLWATRMRRLKLVEPRFANSERLHHLLRRRLVLRLCRLRRKRLPFRRHPCSLPHPQHGALHPAIRHFLDPGLYQPERFRPRYGNTITLPPPGMDLSNVKTMTTLCDWQKQQKKMYARFCVPGSLYRLTFPFLG